MNSQVTFEEFDLNNPSHIAGAGVWAVASPTYLKLCKSRAAALNSDRPGAVKLYELVDGRWELRGQIGGEHDPMCDVCGAGTSGSFRNYPRWMWRHEKPGGKVKTPLEAVYACGSCRLYA
jgi:hypothetical protein